MELCLRAKIGGSRCPLEINHPLEALGRKRNSGHRKAIQHQPLIGVGSYSGGGSLKTFALLPLEQPYLEFPHAFRLCFAIRACKKIQALSGSCSNPTKARLNNTL